MKKGSNPLPTFKKPPPPPSPPSTMGNNLNLAKIDKQLKLYQRECLIGKDLEGVRAKLAEIKGLIKDEENELKKRFKQLVSVKTAITGMTKIALGRLYEREKAIK